MKTRENILEKALLLFNTSGIENVGVREIAKELDIRPGNVTYYFPKKEDIVTALGSQLSSLNSATIEQFELHTIKEFMQRYHILFQNHYQFRCLFSNIVGQMQQNPVLAENYKKIQQRRRLELKDILLRLQQNGYLKNDVIENDIEHLISFLSLVSRFWISEAELFIEKPTTAAAFKHYLQLIGFVLTQHLTEKGKADVSEFFEVL